MERKGFTIDPEPPQPRDAARGGRPHPLATAAMALTIAGVIGAAVWFFGFSEWGVAWEGNEARKAVDAPEDVATSYPRVVLSLDEISLMCEPGESVRLRPEIAKSANAGALDTKDIRIKWVSQNPAVAEVDDRGVVTATGTGTATITATVANDDVDSNPTSCLVTVRIWSNDKNAPKDTAATEDPAYYDPYYDPYAEAERTTAEIEVDGLRIKAHGDPVFGGLGMYDRARNEIMMVGTKSFIVYSGGDRQVVTLREGDKITNITCGTDGYITCGNFHIGSKTVKAKDIRVKL